MRDLTRFLNGLRSTLPEVPIEPELKPEREDHDRSIRCAWWSPGREQPGWWLGQYEQSPSAPANREEQDLAAGAVLQAVTEYGEGDGSPQEGDLVRCAELCSCCSVLPLRLCAITLHQSGCCAGVCTHRCTLTSVL
jgi:hypothetical protein